MSWRESPWRVSLRPSAERSFASPRNQSRPADRGGMRGQNGRRRTVAKLAATDAVLDRLSGMVTAPDRRAVASTEPSWIGVGAGSPHEVPNR